MASHLRLFSALACCSGSSRAKLRCCRMRSHLSSLVPRMALVEIGVDLVSVRPGFPIACAPPPKCIPLTVRASALVLCQPGTHLPLLLVNSVAVCQQCRREVHAGTFVRNGRRKLVCLLSHGVLVSHVLASHVVVAVEHLLCRAASARVAAKFVGTWGCWNLSSGSMSRRCETFGTGAHHGESCLILKSATHPCAHGEGGACEQHQQRGGRPTLRSHVARNWRLLRAMLIGESSDCMDKSMLKQDK